MCNKAAPEMSSTLGGLVLAGVEGLEDQRGRVEPLAPGGDSWLRLCSPEPPTTRASQLHAPYTGAFWGWERDALTFSR